MEEGTLFLALFVFLEQLLVSMIVLIMTLLFLRLNDRRVATHLHGLRTLAVQDVID